MCGWVNGLSICIQEAAFAGDRARATGWASCAFVYTPLPSPQKPQKPTIQERNAAPPQHISIFVRPNKTSSGTIAPGETSFAGHYEHLFAFVPTYRDLRPSYKIVTLSFNSITIIILTYKRKIYAYLSLLYIHLAIPPIPTSISNFFFFGP